MTYVTEDCGNPTGWFADLADEAAHGQYPWAVFIQTAGGCFDLSDLRFDSRDGAERFIRDSVLDRGMLP